MGDTVLGTTVKEKDLGITISADVSWEVNCVSHQYKIIYCQNVGL